MNATYALNAARHYISARNPNFLLFLIQKQSANLPFDWIQTAANEHLFLTQINFLYPFDQVFDIQKQDLIGFCIWFFVLSDWLNCHNFDIIRRRRRFLTDQWTIAFWENSRPNPCGDILFYMARAYRGATTIFDINLSIHPILSAALRLRGHSTRWNWIRTLFGKMSPRLHFTTGLGPSPHATFTHTAQRLLPSLTFHFYKE